MLIYSTRMALLLYYYEAYIVHIYILNQLPLLKIELKLPFPFVSSLIFSKKEETMRHGNGNLHYRTDS